jgi:hypothetical protein
MWFAGIDWADTHHDALVIDETGQRAGSLRVAQTKAGREELKRFLLGIAKTPDQLACIVETSQGLLITALLEAGFTVYPVNPKTVDRRRNGAFVKTDAVDAAIFPIYWQNLPRYPSIYRCHPILHRPLLSRDHDSGQS